METDKIKINIGIFFDGTGNNAFNIRKTLDLYDQKQSLYSDAKSEKKIKQTASDIFNLSGNEANSYTSYYTNIYWLSCLYKKNIITDGTEIQAGIYIEGIGTTTGEPDSVLGQSFGISDTGIIAKTEKATERLTAVITDIIDNYRSQNANVKIEIQSVTFDLFGFSRGATALRHFANRIYSEEWGIVKSIREGMQDIIFWGSPSGKIRFIGIFDTVSAVGTLANGWDPHKINDGNINIDLPEGIADNVFHITAMHECRFNFPLNSIKPIWPEIALPGVHSDIGGGYLPVVEENIFLSRPETETVPFNFPDKETRVYYRAVNKLSNLETLPNINSILQTANVSAETWYDARLPLARNSEPQKRTYAAVALRNRSVRNDWSKVTLRVMLSVAQEAGVLFEDINNSNRELSIHDSLMSICEKAISNGNAVFRNQPADEFNHEELAIISRYIHCSANWNAIDEDSNGVIQGGAHPLSLINFVNRPDDNWTRTIYEPKHSYDS